MGNCLTLEESKRQAEVHRSATISPSKSNASAASLGLNSPDNAPKLSHAESDKLLGSSVNKTGNSANVLRKLNRSIGNSVHNIGDPTTASLSKSNISNRSIGGISTGSMPVVPKDVTDLRLNPGYTNVDIFTYEEMRQATKNFRPDLILGEGGFGVVYKGVIDDSIRQGYQSTKVAIKELNPDGFQGDREWLAEVSYLGQLSHTNLVKLIGYCCEDEHRLLVYEYMACGSLEKHLFRRVCLTLPWSTRMKIAFGAAKGLAFLHGQERSVIYRDFKTANILLDREYNAKLSDFGLAKDGPMGDQTHVSTRVMGTYGYAAPEYVMTGHLTARSDVYGFGVVLLEMLIGRRALDKSRPSREHNLVDWARPLLNHNRRLLKILDPRMDGQYSVRDATKVANLAYTCLSQNPKGRPTMSQVVTILEEFQTPHDEQRGGSSGAETGPVTLYEALDSAPPETESRRRSSRRKEAEKTPNTHSDHHHKSSRGRSRSAPFVENDVYKLSPDYELHRESSVDNPDPNRHHQ